MAAVVAGYRKALVNHFVYLWLNKHILFTVSSTVGSFQMDRYSLVETQG